MKRNRNLKVTISNQPTRVGCMNLNFAISRFSEEYPQTEIAITIYEVSSDGTEKKLCERKNGEWIDDCQL